MLRFSKHLFFLLFAFALLLSACGENTQDQSLTSPSDVSDEFRSYPIDISISDTKLSELIEHVELMRLEETDESLLSSTFRVSEVGSKIIFPGDNEGTMHAFSTTGKFLDQFNKKGDGPGEYGMISTIWMEGDSIVIYDGLKQTARWYDSEGRHLKDQRMPEGAAHVYPYAGGYALDMSFRFIQDSLKYQVLLVDKRLNYQQKLIPYELSVPFPMTSTVNTFATFNGRLTFKSPFADTTYFVGAEGAIPFYHIDFGNQYLWADRSLYENGQAGMSAINDGKSVWIFKALTGPRQILMTYNTSFSDFGIMLIQRESGKYVLLDLSKNVEEQYNFGIIGWSGDRLLASVSSDDIAELLGELNEDQWQFKNGTTLEEIESSENPVMMWVKFKDVIE